MLSKALDGMRVLDLSQGIAGPHGACLLGEMGAKVTKVEPPSGDWCRGLGLQRGGSSVLFSTFNRGKRSLCLDLKDARGREVIRKFASSADVLIESNRPGVMGRLGLDFQSLSALNPRLVYVSVTGFGQTGPYNDRPATDAAIQAYTGFSYAAADMVTPARVRISLVDVITGVYVSQAILGALLMRDRTNRAEYLDISLAHCLTAVQGYKYAEHQYSGGVLPREVFPGIGQYRTRDGYITLSAMRDSQIVDLFSVIGKADQLLDPQFATPEARFRNQDAIRELISHALAAERTSYWMPRLQQADLICQEVLTYDSYRRDPQVLHKELFQESNLGSIGVLPSVRMPGLSAAEACAETAPDLGENTLQLLRQQGLTNSEIAALIDSGIAIQAARADEYVRQ